MLNEQVQNIEQVEPVVTEVKDTVQPPPIADTYTSDEDSRSRVREALKNGYSREEVVNGLQKKYGLTAETADAEVVTSVKSAIEAAKSQGYTIDQIKDQLIVNRYDGSLIDEAIGTADLGLQKLEYKGVWDTIKTQFKEAEKFPKYMWDPNEPQEEAKDLADLYKNVNEKYSTVWKSTGMMGQDAAVDARRELNRLNISIVSKLNEQGIEAQINPEDGEVYIKNTRGGFEELDSSVLNDIYNSKGEFGGAIGGAIAGGKAGSKIGAVVAGVAGNTIGGGAGVLLPEEAVTVPAGSAVGGALGTVVGGAMGAMFGRSVDLVNNAVKLKENIEGELFRTQIMEAGIADGVFTVLGAGAFKVAGGVAKSVSRAYDFYLKGNVDGAYKSLLDNMLISDGQAKEIVENWEALTGKAAPGVNDKEKAIAVVSTTQQGAEAFVTHAAAKDPKAAMQIIQDIDQRAKDLLKLADGVADDNVGDLMRNQLQTYTKDVKQFYGEVKDIAAKEIDGTDFRFDYNSTTLDPVLKDIRTSLSNPTQREIFVSYSERIAAASEDRTFSGLLNLREAVNDFKYSRAKLKKPALDSLNKVLNKIDAQIGKTVKEYMPDNGKEWLEQFKLSKKEYAKMKQMEGNVLFKLLNRKGITEAGIQKGLTRYIDSLDGTFLEVMEKLPPKTRAKAEGAVVKQYMERYTLGNATDSQALHFPMIAQALKDVNIVTPEAKYLKSITESLAKVFKNDVNLSKISGNIAVPKFQSYLTTDPVVRLKFEIATGVFNAIKTKIPGKMANNMALLNQLEKTLENPMKADIASKFLKYIPEESREAVTSLMEQLRNEMAKNPQKPKDFVNMYKQSATGKFVKTDGALGKGVYLVDKVKNPSSTSKVLKKEVNMSRMATLDDISKLLGREVDIKELRKLPELKKQLEDSGYIGIRVEGKAMLFDE